MSWASRRQFMIIASLAAVVIAIVAVTVIAIVYETPSCTDGKRNADERGVDCGGACSYMCLADVERPVIRFVRPISPQQGRYDVIAYVDNRNPSLAATGVRANIELFDEARTSLGTREVVFDIPAGGTVPVYVAEAYRGSTNVAQAFMVIDDASLKFFEPPAFHTVPSVTNVETENSGAPRIRAVMENLGAYPIYNIKPIATVFDISGNAIAASQSYVPQLGPRSEVDVIFTWNRPFAGPPARVEVLPVVPVQGI